MPQLKIVGKNELITITVEQAENLAGKRWGKEGGVPTADKKDLVRINGVADFSVGDIRNIFYDEKNTYDEKTHQNVESLAACKKRQDEVRKWKPIEKAERMIKTYCYLMYKANGNEGRVIEDPTYSKLIKPLLEYFEKNKNDHYAPKEIWEKEIPRASTISTDILGWQTLGQKLNRGGCD